MEDMTDWLIRRENSIGREETADELKHKYEKALDDLVKYEKERQEDKEKIKELEAKNKELNIIRLNMLLGKFPDTTETYKKYKKELNDLLQSR